MVEYLDNMLTGTVTRLTNETATVTFAGGQTLDVKTEDIEGVPVLGSVINLILASPGSEDAGRQRLAKDLLNEVMG